MNNIVILIIIIIIIIIYCIRYNIIYYISIKTSKLFCDKTNINNLLKCKNIYVNNNDFSAPANCLRLGINWENDIYYYIKKYSNKKYSAIDIGAHIGIHTQHLSKYYKSVYAFEPNTNTYNTLKLNTKNNNIITINKAVGNENKKVIFFIKKINCQSHVEHFDDIKLVDQIKIDDLNLKEKIKIIKIDIEGGEINAFKGMYQLIKTNKPIIIFEDHTGENCSYLKKTHNYKIKKINLTNYLALL